MTRLPPSRTVAILKLLGQGGCGAFMGCLAFAFYVAIWRSEDHEVTQRSQALLEESTTIFHQAEALHDTLDTVILHLTRFEIALHDLRTLQEAALSPADLKVWQLLKRIEQLEEPK